MSNASHVRASSSALLTDQYELTMAASYLSQSRTASATFDLFVRSLPPERRFLVAAGLEDALDYLEHLRFTDSDIAYLRGLDTFSDEFLNYLADFRFTGEVWAIPEGQVCFPNEPLLRVSAPLIEAQIVETALLNTIAHQTGIASKAARVAIAAGEREFVDFAARRTHGPDAAVRGARAAYLAGAAGTSNVLAGRLHGIPVSGTMAHSYVMAFDDERDAFRAFARDFPSRAVLLIDTYDTLEGARRAVEVAHELEDEGIHIAGVRLDSGDLGELAKGVRDILDAGGLTEARIVASGDLDEYRIAALLVDGAPIDSFGVGTQMGVSADVPALGGVYKLVEYDGQPVVKLSTGKATLPGRKQVWREVRGGQLRRDTIGLDQETDLPGEPLLVKAMVDGDRVGARGAVEQARERCARSLAQLPPSLRALEAVPEDDEPEAIVETSEELDALLRRTRSQVSAASSERASSERAQHNGDA